MEPSTFRSATVEEYDEREHVAHGGGPSHPGGDVDGVSPMITQNYRRQPHTCESRELLQQGPTEIQPVMQYPDGMHHSYDDMEPHLNRLPTVPTPPVSIRPKRSKTRTSFSTRRRNKDRPEYYGVSDARGAAASVTPSGSMPTVPVGPDPLPPSSNPRMTRRPTTGWYVAGSPHASPADLPRGGIAANPPPRRTYTAPNDTARPPQDDRPTSSFRSVRNSDGMKPRTQQPPQYRQNSHDRDRGATGMNNPEPETYPPNVGVPHYPPSQHNPRGFTVLTEGHGIPHGDPNTQASRKPQEGYSRSPHLYPHSPPLPPQAQNSPHGLTMLSSNNRQPASPADEGPYQPRSQRVPSNSHERRPSFPANQWPRSHPDARVAVHQTHERQSTHHMHPPSAQWRTVYSGGHDRPPRDAPSRAASNPCPQFQRLSVQDPPPRDRTVRQAVPHARTGPFRSQDTYQSGPSHPGTVNSYNSRSHPTYCQPPQNRPREQDPAANESSHYASHSQRSYPNGHGQYYSAQPQPNMDMKGPAVPGDWPESPRQRAPAASHTPRPPHVYRPIQEGNGQQSPPHSTAQATYPAKSRRYEAPQGAHYSRETYRELEEESEPTFREPDPLWTNKRPGDTPSLPDGHPFLRIKHMALAAILEDFRAWQSSGMPGRRGPGRRPPFACPFAKNDPLRYKDCFSDILPGIQDVKEHVSRCHAIPIYCPRCMELFADEKARDHHIRHADCRAQQWACPDGVTESQKRQLGRDVPAHLPAPDQWSRIFSVIFHGQQERQQQGKQQQQQRVPTPESPYVDEILHEDIATYRDFLEARGPRVLSDTLTFRGAATWNLPNEERDLAAFRRLVLDEGVRDLVDQWAARTTTRRREDHLHHHHSPPSLAGSSSSADHQRTPSMGSFASSSDGHQGGRAHPHPPSSPAGPHHWDHHLGPRVREDGWDDPGVVGRAEHGDFAEAPRYKMGAYHDRRRGLAGYCG